LTEEDVRTCISLKHSKTVLERAAIFGVSTGAIYRIDDKKTWKHVTDGLLTEEPIPKRVRLSTESPSFDSEDKSNEESDDDDDSN
jgi:hypothetical protein